MAGTVSRFQPAAHCTGSRRDGDALDRPRLQVRRKSLARALVCVILIASAGCSGQSTFLTGGPTVGQLKTSLSHLEYENEQLKKRTAKLEQENRSIENRLVQEQLSNGDLTARLDDARNLLRDRGLESEVKLGSRRRNDENNDASSSGEGTTARTLPAGRTSRPRRKAPFAQISSGPGNAPLSEDPDGGSATGSRKSKDAKSDRSRRRNTDDFDQHSFQSGSLKWLPIADANDDSTIQIR